MKQYNFGRGFSSLRFTPFKLNRKGALQKSNPKSYTGGDHSIMRWPSNRASEYGIWQTAMLTRLLTLRQLAMIDTCPPSACCETELQDVTGEEYFLVSHRWLSESHPDPSFQKAALFKKWYYSLNQWLGNANGFLERADDTSESREEYRKLLDERIAACPVMPISVFNQYHILYTRSENSPMRDRPEWMIGDINRLISATHSVLNGQFWIDWAVMSPLEHRQNCRRCAELYEYTLQLIPQLITSAEAVIVMNGFSEDEFDRGWIQTEIILGSSSEKLIKANQGMDDRNLASLIFQHPEKIESKWTFERDAQAAILSWALASNKQAFQFILNSGWRDDQHERLCEIILQLLLPYFDINSTVLSDSPVVEVYFSEDPKKKKSLEPSYYGGPAGVIDIKSFPLLAVGEQISIQKLFERTKLACYLYFQPSVTGFLCQGLGMNWKDYGDIFIHSLTRTIVAFFWQAELIERSFGRKNSYPEEFQLTDVVQMAIMKLVFHADIPIQVAHTFIIGVVEEVIGVRLFPVNRSDGNQGEFQKFAAQIREEYEECYDSDGNREYRPIPITEIHQRLKLRDRHS